MSKNEIIEFKDLKRTNLRFYQKKTASPLVPLP